jgi:hypothetical protein
MRTRSVLDRSHCCFRRAATATPAISEPAELSPQRSTAVATPNGRAVADEALAWLNRQLSWQSTLADLERVAVGHDSAVLG